MSSLAIASIVFVCVFSSGLLGLFVRASLPKHHLSDDSTGVVKLGTGLIATLAALVLGLADRLGKDLLRQDQRRGHAGLP